MADYRLHPITWKNVIDYNWLQLQIYDYRMSAAEQVKYRDVHLVYWIDIVIVDVHYNELYELHDVDLLVKMQG